MHVMVYTTCVSRTEAKKIATILVGEKLVACVNYFPVKSVYAWSGRVESAGEYVLLCKTLKKNVRKLEKRIKAIHSYECPAFAVYPMVSGSSEYLAWISENTE